MLNILPLAFAAAVYPTLLAGVIVILGRPAPRPLLLGFLLGGLLISMTAGAIIVFALDGAVSTSHQQSASPTVDIVAGAISLILAGVLARKQDVIRARREKRAAKQAAKAQAKGKAEPREPLSTRLLSRGSARSAFALGLVLNLPGVWYLVALKDIAKGNYSVPGALALMLVFNAIMFLLVEIPLIGYLISPEGTRVRVNRFQAWLGDNAQSIAKWAAAAIGFYLIIRGIAGLT